MHGKASGAGSAGRLWDVAVIGGGPAGMMAAGCAAESGASVVLLEKNAELGKKLLITGGGRCNVTNAELDVRKFLARYGSGGKFLASPFSRWSARETLDFFHARGMATKEEAGGRVFPASDDARSVWNVLVKYMKDGGVRVRTGAQVAKLIAKDGSLVAAELRGGEEVRARSFVLATGGLSHPETGSTGDGYAWLRELGHSIRDTSAALVPVAIKDPQRIAGAAGVSMQSAKITLFQNGAKRSQRRGKILFTHVGLSGPAILNMSREVGELLEYGSVAVEIDLLPDRGYEKVNAGLQELFKLHSNKLIRNALSDLVPPGLVPVVLSTARIDPETPCHSVKREERIALMRSLKHCRFEASHLLGMEKAVVTAGGVSPTEVDLRTMGSQKCRNLFLVGDVLDIDRPSGGYSLQLCWTTGYTAGTSAVVSYSHRTSGA